MARTNAISISDGFIPSKIDTPLDERSRVKTFNEIADIPRPYVGMVIYVEDEDAYYSVKSLKAKNIGGIMVNNAQVNEVKPFGGGIIVVDSLNDTENIGKGQLFAHYTPDTKFTGAKVQSLGIGVGDSDGYLLDKKDALATRSIAINDSFDYLDWHQFDGIVHTYDIVEVVFSNENIRHTLEIGKNGILLYLDNKMAGNIDIWSLGAGTTEYFDIDLYLVSYTRKRMEIVDGTSNGLTTTIKRIDINNYAEETAELEQWLGNVVSFSGGTPDTLEYYSRTSNGIEKFGGNSQSKGGMPVVQFDLSLTDGECDMMPNTYYVLGETNYLYLYFSGADPSIVNEYCCEFTAGGNGCTLLLADDVLWANGNTPEIEGGKTYQLSVVNNLAIITEFK